MTPKCIQCGRELEWGDICQSCASAPIESAKSELLDIGQDKFNQDYMNKVSSRCGDGLLDEALSELRDRRRYCLRMELICHRAGEPDVAKNWSIKASECLKSIQAVRKVANIKRVAE